MAAGFSVTISAVDHASSTLAKVNASVQVSRDRVSQLTAPFRRFGQEVKQFGDVTGINRFGAGLEQVTERASRFTAGLTKIVPALATVTGAASLAGIVAMTVKFAAAETQLGMLSQRLSVSAENLSQLQIAMKLANGSAEDLTAGAMALKGSIQDAIGGRNAEAVETFRRLGVEFKDSAGKARPLKDVMQETATALSKIQDPQLRATVGAKLFGGAIEGLNPLIGRSAEGQRALMEEARKLNGVTDEGVRQAGLFASAQSRMGVTVEQLGNKISEKVLPVLTPLLERLATFVANNSDKIAAFFERVAQAVGKWVDSGGIDKTIVGLTDFATKVDAIVQSVGGWEVAAKGLLVFMAGAWVLGMVASVASVLGTVNQLGGALRGLPAAPTVPGPTSGGGGGGMLGSLGRMASVFNLVGIAQDMSKPRTAEDRRQFNTEGFAARLGQAIGEALGLKFDSEGKSAGLLAQRFGGGASGAAARSYEGATPRERQGAVRFAAAPGPSTEQQKSRAAEARDYFISQGYTKEQAAGLVANIHKESSFNPGAIGDGGDGRGIGQWHPDRQKDILNGTGIDVRSASYSDQLKAMGWELSHTERNAGDALRRTRTANEAGATVSEMYERPKDRFGEMAGRGASATDWLRQWNAAPAGPGPTIASPMGMSGPPLAFNGAANQNGAGAAGGGRAIVDVNFTNPPPGANVSVRTQGDLQQGSVRIARPNLLTGTP